MGCQHAIPDFIVKKESNYVSSITSSAGRILRAICDHWVIENILHWALDMSFNEAYSIIRKENILHVMAINYYWQQKKTVDKGCRCANITLERAISKKTS